MSWRQTKLAYSLIATFSLGIASALAVLGYWPVLPFAGGELMALGACFWMCARRGQETEVVSVREDVVEVAKSYGRQPRTWCFQRPWARVEMLRPRIRTHPSRLVIRSHGRQVNVGDFLTEAERRALAGDLRSAIAGAA